VFGEGDRCDAFLVVISGTVRVTKLAEDLGTSREIVSRILESFEAQGFVRLGRGKIQLADAPAIRRQYLD
jgi:CRP-like cAMP-binding protein